MSPAEQQFWITVLLGALTGGLTLISVLFWRLWATLATKVELERLKTEIVHEDGASDERWAETLRNEIRAVEKRTVAMHQENKVTAAVTRDEFRKSQGEILTILHELRGRDRARQRT